MLERSFQEKNQPVNQLVFFNVHREPLLCRLIPFILRRDAINRSGQLRNCERCEQEWTES
jgi:hypothetical protein